MFFSSPAAAGLFFVLPLGAVGAKVRRLWYLFPLTLGLSALLQFRQLWHVGGLEADGVVWFYHTLRL